MAGPAQNRGTIFRRNIYDPVLVWQGAYIGSAPYDVGDVVTWDNGMYMCISATMHNAPPNPTYWSQMAGSTTSPLSAGPPSNAGDGDTWTATSVDSDGIRWQFQYDSNWTTDAYKWKFIGGPPSVRLGVTSNGWAANAWNDMAGGAVVTRAGIYNCRCAISGQNSTAAQTFELGIGVNTTTSVHRILALTTVTSTWDFTLFGEDWLTIPAGATVWVNGLGNGTGSVAPTTGSLTILPVRIS